MAFKKKFNADIALFRPRLVKLLNNSVLVFKQYYIFFHTLFTTCISKNYKQHYSNFFTKRVLKYQMNFFADLDMTLCVANDM